jgi:hypothetical protein
MTSLFREKDRLVALDKAAAKKKRKATVGRKTKAKSKSKSLDDKDDDEVVTTTSKAAQPASQVAEASIATRTHLKRSATRKPVRYRESATLSSDVDGDLSDIEEDHDDVKVAEMLGTSSRSNRTKKQAEAMSDGDLFGHGSDLSDMSSDVEDQPRRSASSSSRGEAESETDSDDDEEEGKAAVMYGFKEGDVPTVTLETENKMQTMSLHSLYRRSKSLKLWLDHLQLLLFFERRKEKIVKEKAAKARQSGNRLERALKTKFSTGLSDAIRRIEIEHSLMQETLEPALKERKVALLQKKRNASKVVTPKKKESDIGNAKAKTTKKTTRTSASKEQEDQGQKKRKRMRVADFVLEVEDPSSGSRKKRLTTKQRNGGVVVSA